MKNDDQARMDTMGDSTDSRTAPTGAPTTNAHVMEVNVAWSAAIDERAQKEELFAALKDILEQFDAGAFVRNTDSDGCSDWAIKAATPLKALAVAQTVVKKVNDAR